ncbi:MULTISPECIES: glycine zipper 2TM domain-containing protein [Xanthomonas]|uniref:Glycine zipper 2TM domain-containing protein n=1 Tax=Xanthomonas cucurbitae TaxID=56453 RepID=A0ABY7Y945_9XANT|nr:glycine zipper 2TM domain-containing protein [Xanthomonas cucurbitae]WDM66514.1 glycine zipper 2TM domain-containing protein [Xanthomonas cucurbitae]WDM70393.1 glycine zipper 2TM domain-containing protein [Xanthomonas cucurbitae]WDM74258.1 glycine zipper 2TM domain-containing protein [Xanthomonas cucurbitae]WDM80286.1 glycine zipper 2TM domain-containing protein [Xanthomonas cucurbitae]WDM83977.1 glycine zipper 2TM domain-containing protein [Xanthomonas cucurbitae]
MKTLVLGALVIGLAAAGTATAQRYDGSYRDVYRDSYRGGYEDGRYEYARVVRVDPILVSDSYTERTNERCYNRPADGYYTSNDGYYRNEGGYASPNSGRGVASVIGGIAGAVLGSQVGGGNGRLVGTAVGTMAGVAAGRSIYEANNRTYRGNVSVCEPVSYRTSRERVDGYDVTYEYGGRLYHTRSDYNPGDRIRVRVDVRPD